jgi:hypothetical protein
VTRLRGDGSVDQGPEVPGVTTGKFSVGKTNRVIILFTPVGSVADSRERCNSVDVNTFLPGRWELAFCLRPP